MDMDTTRQVLFVILLGLGMNTSGGMLGSATFLEDLPPYLLCKTRCQSKCYAENISASKKDQCQHCDIYDEQWMNLNCSDPMCQSTCNDLIQNKTGQVPLAPLVQKREKYETLFLSWDNVDESQIVYLLLQRESDSHPWSLLTSTTEKEYEYIDFQSPPCQNVTSQICVIAVNQFGSSPQSNIIHVGYFKATDNFRLEKRGLDSKNTFIQLKFKWSNSQELLYYAGHHTVSLIGYDTDCNVTFYETSKSTRDVVDNKLTLPIEIDAASKSCLASFKLHHESSCYVIKEQTLDVQFDCRYIKFRNGSNICDGTPRCLAPSVSGKSPSASVTTYTNESAMVSWTIEPECMPDSYNTIVRWGEINNDTKQIDSEKASTMLLPVTQTSLLLTGFEQAFIYGVHVMISEIDDINLKLVKIHTFKFSSAPTIPPSTQTTVVTEPIPIAQCKTLDETLVKPQLVAVAVIVIMAIMLTLGWFCIKHNGYYGNRAVLQDEESKPDVYSTIFAGGELQLGSTHQTDPLLSDRWEIPFSHIQTGEILGQGAFGKVIKGKIQGRVLTFPYADSNLVSTSVKSKDVEVAVKMLHEYAMGPQKQEFMREIKLMKNIGYHANVVSLIACCTYQDPICLVVEHCSKGDLLNFLRNRRPHYFVDGSSTPAQDSLSAIELLSFARQVILGMEYLSQKGYVHRDIAARNVLVMEDQTLKIGDFGLTRYVYDDKVYVRKHNSRLPIKWMSIESLFDDVFTSKSDVWSFGVLLFEIITLGSAPYPGVSNYDIPRFLKRGYRMDQPDGCSDELYAIMECCWQPFQEDRPSFTDLRNYLENILQQHTPYLDLDLLVGSHEDSDSQSSCSDSLHSGGPLELGVLREVSEEQEQQEELRQQQGNYGDQIEETRPMI